MLTYSFTELDGQTLYQHLYHCLKKDIIEGNLKENDRLPSKRSFAKNLGISVITVENAYAQLLAEGYIYSLPKKGYYVEAIAETMLVGDREFREMEDKINRQNCIEKRNKQHEVEKEIEPETEEQSMIDFASNRNNPKNFPFSVWAKLSKETIADDPQALMTPSPANGVYELRQAICRYLSDFRGMSVDPARVIIGAGTEYLYSLLIQLLGYDKAYAVEDPGYKKLYQIYRSNHVECHAIPLDSKGISMKALECSDTDVLHITPAHHFPTGIVTPIGRRYELLNWAAQADDRYIIEDDFDSEFRMVGKSIPMLQSIDRQEKVIYMNTFSKSLSSTIRISYMVLPLHLAEQFHEKLGFYACTVSTFEQFTLARFISEGYFEKHINRMRTYYKNLKKQLIETIRTGPCADKVEIAEEEAGLHFLLKVRTDLSDLQIKEKALSEGYRVLMLSDCYIREEEWASFEKNIAKTKDADQQVQNAVRQENTHTLVINYSGMEEGQMSRINELLKIL